MHVGTCSGSNENAAASTPAIRQSQGMWYIPAVAPRFTESSILTRASTADSGGSWSSFGAQSSPSSDTSYDTVDPTHGTTSQSASSERSKMEGQEYGRR